MEILLQDFVEVGYLAGKWMLKLVLQSYPSPAEGGHKRALPFQVVSRVLHDGWIVQCRYRSGRLLSLDDPPTRRQVQHTLPSFLTSAAAATDTAGLDGAATLNTTHARVERTDQRYESVPSFLLNTMQIHAPTATEYLVANCRGCQQPESYHPFSRVTPHL
jgi:hypothetical protein